MEFHQVQKYGPQYDVFCKQQREFKWFLTPQQLQTMTKYNIYFFFKCLLG